MSEEDRIQRLEERLRTVERHREEHLVDRLLREELLDLLQDAPRAAAVCTRMTVAVRVRAYTRMSVAVTTRTRTSVAVARGGHEGSGAEDFDDAIPESFALHELHRRIERAALVADDDDLAKVAPPAADAARDGPQQATLDAERDEAHEPERDEGALVQMIESDEEAERQ